METHTGYINTLMTLSFKLQQLFMGRAFNIAMKSFPDQTPQLQAIRVAGFSLQHGYHSNPTTPKLQHTSNQEQYDQCGNSAE